MNRLWSRVRRSAGDLILDRVHRIDPVRRDKILGVFYLALVPAMVVVILVIGFYDHRDNVRHARQLSRRADAIAQRAEEVARNSCEAAAVLRDVLSAVLPKKNPPNLTPAQEAQLEVFRLAVARLAPLSCNPPRRPH